MDVGSWKFILVMLILSFLTNCESSKNPEKLLFEKAKTQNFVELKNESSADFMFFQGGNFLEDSTIQALFITAPSDSTYNIELYSLNQENWDLVDKMENLKAFPSQFEITYNDYNFDEQTDLFVQVSASQGYSVSKGHLLIVNPKSKKFELHNEARELGNMKPDYTQKIVFSEISHGYNINNSREISILSNKWIDGKLKTIDEKRIIMKP
jgi:hypothetical protein